MNIGKILPEKEFGRFSVIDFSKPLKSSVAQAFEVAEQKGEGVILKDLSSVTKPDEKIAVLFELDNRNEILQNSLDCVAAIAKATQEIKADLGLPVGGKVENIVTKTKSNIPIFIAEKSGKMPSDVDGRFLRDGRVFGFLNYEA